MAELSILANILVIDDEEVMRDSCKQILSRQGHNVKLAEDGYQGLELLKEKSFDLVILDLKMPGIDGMEVLEKIKESSPETAVVVITGYATVESAVEAMKRGAYDFLPKPFTPEEFRLIIERALEKKRLILENIYLRQELEVKRKSEVIIGKSEVMQKVYELIRRVGPTDSTVLILGESGTGKELVAKAIHYHSRRKNKPFITVDCGALVENLFESELFGHVKGSFTDAASTKHGRFEVANEGTLFFDEIGNIGPNVQAKLLRAIQEREITRIGSSKTIKIDVRIIAATNKNLRKAIQEKTFREDLFYRLSVVPITLPLLRERPEDIPELANYFLKKYNQKRGKNLTGISPRAMKALTEYSWPGNVRELENAIERAVVLAKGNVIEPSDMSYYGLAVDPSSGPMAGNHKRLIDVEAEHILKILKETGWQKSQTAKLLGVDRKTLRAKMKKYRISENLGNNSPLLGRNSPGEEKGI
ncbi:MAG: sigma-54-dependent Fis family transcriptional regulator [Candidatus Aerophobus sp.]|nr:MAG: sigma-54-dependent Fis family transcriptional regulator [Candidatus Aerophobus sp.]